VTNRTAKKAEPSTEAASPTQTEVIVREPSTLDVMFASFAAIGFAVSARVLLFLSLLGAFALSVMAIYVASITALIVLGMFCAFTTLPLVALELKNKQPKV
jgi:hypothetical protein